MAEEDEERLQELTPASAPLSAVQSGSRYIPSTLVSDDENTVIDNHKFLRSELRKPSAADFNPGYTEWPKHEAGNASSVGLASFGVTTFVLGLYLAQAMGIETINIAIAPAIFFGGVIQFLAGVALFIIGGEGNTFAATVFTSYGSFWLSFGSIFIPAFQIASAYGDDIEQFNHAVGFFLLGWAIFTFFMFLVTFKSTWPLLLLFFTLDFGFFMLSAGYLVQSTRCIRGGGVLIFLSSLFGLYACFAGISTSYNSYLIFPAGTIPVQHNKTKSVPV
ncbi:hypothetical protein KGF54_000505 [Candida jiufengensis]|uniref:uncharacterized protein n=1 Tax=Candida jiufengensis TaxID=497108 RepID=UPI0022257384|nr:uncharacterized protein KGF54_000505 [Candida jiufengensis]KAI5956887.1 hypothetical protein KGF54_000505 [Candida jiufengensis]